METPTATESAAAKQREEAEIAGWNTCGAPTPVLRASVIDYENAARNLERMP
jgi:hypothetical protein